MNAKQILQVGSSFSRVFKIDDCIGNGQFDVKILKTGPRSYMITSKSERSSITISATELKKHIEKWGETKEQTGTLYLSAWMAWKSFNA